MLEFPPFRLDTVNQCLWRRKDGAEDERILVPPKAYGVLRYLIEHAGRLVTQDELLDAVWADRYVQPEGRRVDLSGDGLVVKTCVATAIRMIARQ